MQHLPKKNYLTTIMASNNYGGGSLGRNLHMCFSGVKWPSSAQLPYPEEEEEDEEEQDQRNSSSFPSSSVFIKNFNSLYDSSAASNNARRKPLRIQSNGSKSRVTHSVEFYDEDDPISDDSTPDFATVYASQRFFFSSPGRSNSIIDSSSLSSPEPDAVTPPECEDNTSPVVVKDSVAVPTYSPDPYLDFRRSMQEMVEARKLTNNVGDNWEYLHELLFCYLALNPKSTHKFIIGAFSDLVMSLMAPENEAGENGSHRKTRSDPGDGGQK